MKNAQTSLEHPRVLLALPITPEQNNVRNVFQKPARFLCRAWKWICEQRAAKSTAHKLHLEHSISLGQRRFAAVIEVQGTRYLVGGGASNVTLLAKLEREEGFEQVLDRTQKASHSRSKPAKKKKAVAKQSGKANRKR